MELKLTEKKVINDDIVVRHSFTLDREADIVTRPFELNGVEELLKLKDLIDKKLIWIEKKSQII